jgi:hypothetical protein
MAVSCGICLPAACSRLRGRAATIRSIFAARLIDGPSEPAVALASRDAHHHALWMFVITEADAAAIRAVFNQEGELSAVCLSDRASEGRFRLSQYAPKGKIYCASRRSSLRAVTSMRPAT